MLFVSFFVVFCSSLYLDFFSFLGSLYSIQIKGSCFIPQFRTLISKKGYFLSNYASFFIPKCHTMFGHTIAD